MNVVATRSHNCSKFDLVRAPPPQSSLRENSCTALPRPASWNLGVLLLKTGKREGKKKRKGRKRDETERKKSEEMKGKGE